MALVAHFEAVLFVGVALIAVAAAVASFGVSESIWARWGRLLHHSQRQVAVDSLPLRKSHSEEVLRARIIH